MINSIRYGIKLSISNKLPISNIRYICELINITRNMNPKSMKLTINLVAVILLVAAAIFTSCEKVKELPIPFDPNATWHFQTDIQPIFNANCITCHNGSRSPDLRSGKSYSALSKGYINPPAESSRLYVKITSSDHLPRTTDIQKQMILYWLKQGALNN